MIQIRGKKQKIFYFVIVVCLCLLFSVYYYGIQMGVVPSDEHSLSVYNAYLYLYKDLNEKMNFFNWICVIVVRFFGVCYGSLRIVWTIFYFFISLFALDLSIRDNKWNCKIYAIPIYIILMVLMHLSGEHLTEYYGLLVKVFNEYPFDIHIHTTLFCLIFLWVCYRVDEERIKSVKIRWIIYIFTCFMCYLVAGKADTLLFIASSMLPLLVALCRKYILNSKSWSKIIIVFLVLIAILNFLIDFSSDEVGAILYSFHIQTFIDVKNLVNQVLAYIACLSGTFNFDIWRQEFSLVIVPGIARIFMVLFIYFLIIKNLIRYFKKEKSVDLSEQIISWGFLLITLGFIFTQLGYWDRARYMNIFLPYGTILLCWNIDRFISFVNVSSHKSFVVISILLILSCYSPDWGKYREEYNVYEKDLMEINELVDQKGLHEGLGPIQIFPPVTMQGRGKHWGYPIDYNDETNSFFLMKDIDYSKEFFDYIVIPKEQEYMYNAAYAEEQVMEKWDEPNEVVEFKCFKVWIYFDKIEDIFYVPH